jgi:hypothetical protein
MLNEVGGAVFHRHFAEKIAGRRPLFPGKNPANAPEFPKPQHTGAHLGFFPQTNLKKSGGA